MIVRIVHVGSHEGRRRRSPVDHSRHFLWYFRAATHGGCESQLRRRRAVCGTRGLDLQRGGLGSRDRVAINERASIRRWRDAQRQLGLGGIAVVAIPSRYGRSEERDRCGGGG